MLHAWQGLGYYRRARALHAAARAVMRDHRGHLPAAVDGLRMLPGIGDYTAKAVAAIAFSIPVLPIDGNGVRVLARIFAVETPMPRAANEVRALATAFEPCPRPSDFAQAIMDLGATVCRPRQPRCEHCPWKSSCMGQRAGIADALPRRAPKVKRPLRQGVAFLLTRSDGAILFRRRPSGGLLGGMHELPSSRWQPVPFDRETALEEAPSRSAWRFYDRPVRHVFTHFTLELETRGGYDRCIASRALAGAGQAERTGFADADEETPPACWQDVTGSVSIIARKSTSRGCVFSSLGSRFRQELRTLTRSVLVGLRIAKFSIF